MKTSVKGIAFIVTLALMLAVWSVTAVAYAPSTAYSLENIDLSRSCSLTVTFAQGDVVFPNESVDLFQVATVNAKRQYQLTEAFAECGFDFTKEPTNNAFGGMVAKANGQILQNSLKPMATQQTNKDGELSFTGLQSGIYLVSSVRCMVENEFYTFESFMIAVAAVDTDGKWEYDVKAFPKACNTTATNGIASFDLIITWEDSGSAHRPDEVVVEIYSDSEVYETITLSAKNNWHYSWSAVDIGQEWDVVQGKLANRYYNLSITRRGDSFIVVNTVKEDEPSKPDDESSVPDDESSAPSDESSAPSDEPSVPDEEKPSAPKTGDTADYTVPYALMTFGGAVLILIGCMGLRRNKDKETV